MEFWEFEILLLFWVVLDLGNPEISRRWNFEFCKSKFEKNGKGGPGKMKILPITLWKSWIGDQYLPENRTWKFASMGSIYSTQNSKCFENDNLWNFGTLKPRNFETRKPRNFETNKQRNQYTKKLLCFQLRESPYSSTYRLPPPGRTLISLNSILGWWFATLGLFWGGLPGWH